MSRIRTLTASLLIGAAALTGCALSNSEPAAATVVHEDDPAFDCLTDGNKVCGISAGDPDVLTDAWQEWDAQEGYRKLRVDPSRKFRVEVDAFSLEKIPQTPGSIVLAASDGMKFRYVVTYL